LLYPLIKVIKVQYLRQSEGGVKKKKYSVLEGNGPREERSEALVVGTLLLGECPKLGRAVSPTPSHSRKTLFPKARPQQQNRGNSPNGAYLLVFLPAPASSHYTTRYPTDSISD
jgi:hypothetical protein